MLRGIKSLMGKGPDADKAADEVLPDAPRPERPTYIVGDIHGRADLLELMLELIDAHIGGTNSTDPQLVFLGDYIDHGPESATVLSRLQELDREFPDNVTCLVGSHERLMLNFIADPVNRGRRWMRHGGATTVKSFMPDFEELKPKSDPAVFQKAAEALRNTIGDTTIAWIDALPLSWTSGNLYAVHAGADPQRPMDDQTKRVLTWGHPEFESTARGDGVWIAHGHTERESPTIVDRRIGLDTAAWKSGKLTACAIQPDGKHDFLQS